MLVYDRHCRSSTRPRLPDRDRVQWETGQIGLGGAILGLFNLIVRPVALFLSAPALILTLCLFYFVLNGILLWPVQFVMPGYVVNGRVAGILGSLVLMVVNWVLHGLFLHKK